DPLAVAPVSIAPISSTEYPADWSLKTRVLSPGTGLRSGLPSSSAWCTGSTRLFPGCPCSPGSMLKKASLGRTALGLRTLLYRRVS
ncbi:hypothetical protein GOODEAATRI_003850, partial [Goodea atripinnis]